MTDRVYPSTKPNGTTKTTTTTTRLPPPPNKTQFQTPTNRHPHRPNPTTNHRQSRRRSCFCLCFFWSTLIIVLLLLIATIAGCILYLLYHPRRPTFSITSLKISEFNLVPNNSDDTTKLTSKLNLTVSTKNPNKKITFFYSPFTITCFSSDNSVLFANGSFKSPFVSKPDNITIIHSTLYGNSVLMDTEVVNKIRSDLKKKSGVPLKIVLDSEARVKIENIVRTKKVGIRIKCEGIHSLVPNNKGGNYNKTSSKSVAANVSAAKCKLDLRIKIWKWTF
uniref:NDR1/HIN1-like protein 6 n=1 Tax=Erigeron canadensis TaxID=72917 RepID=UPI001CB9A905|nr:NDR1/HIN1-like protein 6 [Erigeron canadensis]